jgi:hypothetical protein
LSNGNHSPLKSSPALARRKSSNSITCYEGGGTLLHLSKSGDPDVRHYHDRLAEWVLDQISRPNPNRESPSFNPLN